VPRAASGSAKVPHESASLRIDSRLDTLVVVPGDRRRAVGAEVTVTADDRVQRRWIVGGGPFQSNVAPEAHFGLGTGKGAVKVRVRYPSGREVRVETAERGKRLVTE